MSPCEEKELIRRKHEAEGRCFLGRKELLCVMGNLKHVRDVLKDADLFVPKAMGLLELTLRPVRQETLDCLKSRWVN